MKKLLSSEVFKYLFFGVLATLVYMGTRLVIFALTQSATTSAVIANVIAIVFAFFTNDYFVFNQVRTGWFNRFVPHIIGQFVNDNISLVNMIETVFSQVLIIVLNYVFSKLLIFKDKK
jgi:putative flippase GtrA